MNAALILSFSFDFDNFPLALGLADSQQLPFPALTLALCLKQQSSIIFSLCSRFLFFITSARNPSPRLAHLTFDKSNYEYI